MVTVACASEHTRTQQPLTRYCLQPGCSERVSTGKCARHSKRHGATAAPRYGSDWREFRQQAVADVMRIDFPRGGPLCWACEQEGIVTQMDELDHIIPLDLGGARLDPRNVQSLCQQHHQAKTAAEIAAKAKGLDS